MSLLNEAARRDLQRQLHLHNAREKAVKSVHHIDTAISMRLHAGSVIRPRIFRTVHGKLVEMEAVEDLHFFHAIKRTERELVRHLVFNMLTGNDTTSTQYKGDIYRVSVGPPNDNPLVVKVETVGVDLMRGHDLIEEGWYDSTSHLPEWMQEKLAVLSIIDPKESPTATIPDVGRRISEHVFWVFSPRR